MPERSPAGGDRQAAAQASPAPGGLAVLVLTCDEERNLPGLLASLAGLRARLYVVDSGSTDATVAQAQAAGAIVWTHEFSSYGAQRNWAQRQLPADIDWVLHLDADERLTPELVAEINSEMQGHRDGVDGWLLRKRTYFLGRWIRHGGHYPSYHLRLFRTAVGRCEERRYDQHFVVAGPVGRLRNDYIDVVTSDLITWTQRHLRWAVAEAAEVRRPTQTGAHVRPEFFGTPIERRRWLRERLYYRAPLYWRPVLYWGYRYILRLGFLDGPEGFLFHFLQGLWLRVMIDAEISRQRCATEHAELPGLAVADRPAPPVSERAGKRHR